MIPLYALSVHVVEPFTLDDYLEYARSNKHVFIGNTRIELKPMKVTRLEPREDELGEVYGTIWSFPRRGRWATHRSDYRGNWPPQVPRLLISLYTKPDAAILDPMMGSGTTCIEALLLGRRCIGVDINRQALVLAWHRLYSLALRLDPSNPEKPLAGISIYQGDARNLDQIGENAVDLVAMHPPYWRAVRYTSGIEGDLSSEKSMRRYLQGISRAAWEAYRVTRPGGHLAVLIGDSRRKRHYVPVSYYVLSRLLEPGFILREEIIKIQHRMKDTRVYWERYERSFLMIKHEKLYILRKPLYEGEERRYRYSTRRSRSTGTSRL